MIVYKIRKNGFFIHVFSGPKLKNPHASKPASDFEAFDPDIIRT